MVIRRVWLFAVGTALVGCTLLTPLDVFDAPPRSDAASDDAKPSDASSDVAANVESGGSDGEAVDAASDAIADVHGCETSMADRIFCDDFDDLNAALDEGRKLSETSGGDVAYATGNAVSPPRTLLATAPDAPTGYVNASAGITIAPGVGKDFRVRFKLRPKKVNSTGNGYNTVFSVGFDNSTCVTRDSGSHERRVALTLRSSVFHATVIGFNATCVDAGTDDLRSLPLPPLADSDAWTEYELRFSSAPCGSSAGSSLRIVRDGNVTCISLPTDPTTFTNALDVRLGLGVGSAWTQAEAEYDDLEVFVDE